MFCSVKQIFALRGSGSEAGMVAFPSSDMSARMKILFAFENQLTSAEADAEVFSSTACNIAPMLEHAWLHVPIRDAADQKAAQHMAGLEIVKAWAPLRPAALRHFFCGLTIVLRRAFWRADVVYTRNLWVAGMSLLFGQKVVFDHYRPWPEQIPPLQPWIHRLFSSPNLLVNICHSNYTRQKYIDFGIPEDKLRCVHNGYDPTRFQAGVGLAQAKQAIGVAPDQKTVIYTGRINHKKGLDLVIEAARQLPELLFLLVGSYGDGPIETMAKGIPNIRIVPWQPASELGKYAMAADVLLIPPSSQPLTQFGSTVLPLKLFFYLASGRPILAGNTPDVAELLQHDRNAYLCGLDDAHALVDGLRTLTQDHQLAQRLGDTARADSLELTWQARAQRIVGIITPLLRKAPVTTSTWKRQQFGLWARQSWRWLKHLISHRSLILPPETLHLGGSAQDTAGLR